MNNSYLKSKTCRRCKRPTFTGKTCKQCTELATMIVESCAMNLAVLPAVALQDCECKPEVLSAVASARAAFLSSGITPETIEDLRDKIHEGVRDGLEELDKSKSQ
jgi:hypothetical protein